MPTTPVRATAKAMPIDRRLFLAAGTAAAVFGVLHAAMARAAPAAFDPAAYVSMWERCGNVVYWDIDRSGCEWFAIYLENGTFPDHDDIRAFDFGPESNEVRTRKLIAYLKDRGQKAGEPIVGAGR
jgi:hypothetical protein